VLVTSQRFLRAFNRKGEGVTKGWVDELASGHSDHIFLDRTIAFIWLIAKHKAATSKRCFIRLSNSNSPLNIITTSSGKKCFSLCMFASNTSTVFVFRPYVHHAMDMVGVDGDGVVQVPMTTYTLVEADRHERGKGAERCCTPWILKFDIFSWTIWLKHVFKIFSSFFRAHNGKFPYCWPALGKIVLVTLWKTLFCPPLQKILPVPVVTS